MMRGTLEAWLRRHRAGGWTVEILDGKGILAAEPFAAGRPPPRADDRDPLVEVAA